MHWHFTLTVYPAKSILLFTSVLFLWTITCNEFIKSSPWMMDSHQKKAFSDHTTIGSGIILKKKKKKRKNESYKCKLTASNTMTVQLCFWATAITFMVSIVHQDSPTMVRSKSILLSDTNKISQTSIHNEFMESKSWISYCHKQRNWIGGACTAHLYKSLNSTSCKLQEPS